MESPGFVHLHLHSQYSLLDGAIKIDDLLQRAKECGMPAVAVTDHGNMFGAVEFYQKAKQAGIKPIIGCEIYVAPGSRFEKTNARGSSEASYHLVLLCLDLQGYRNLCTLVSAAYREGFYYKPRVDWNLLREHNAGLIALTACLGGEIPTLINLGRLDEARTRVQAMAAVFDDGRLYLELQENFLPEQETVNRGMITLSRELGLPLVATNDCHYLTREDAFAHEVLLCIQTGKTLDDPTRMRFSNEEFYVKTPQEMAALFREQPEALANTLRIAERCDLRFDFGPYHFPQFDAPDGQSLDELLAGEARAGLEQRLAAIRQVRPAFTAADEQGYRVRLEEELRIISQMGFPGYFLIVSDFINWAKNNGIPVGPGRGSAAGSLVAYALRITDIDPIPYNLLFERFLNPERISMPDIDVDFCINGREDVIRYVREKYGEENVAQIITFGTMLAKGVVRDVGRALGMPYGEVDRIAKLIPDTAKTLREAQQQEPRLLELMEAEPKIGELFKIALSLEGLTRHASTHAAGVVVTPRALTEYLPLYTDPKTGGQVTQFSMNFVEKIGLVKFDFLGLKTLTVIDNCLKLVRRREPDFDLNLIADNDPATFQLLSDGKTTGVFQLESSGMREYLAKLHPSCFEDLIAMVALYRPGPLGSGMVDAFIRRKHGQEKIDYPLPQLEPILKDTYGVIVYQEQVMQIAQALASYTLGGADLLRRAMGKKKPEEMAKERAKFLAGARENRIDPKKAEGVFDLMEKFAEYGFNKSHSAAYALVAYHTAYLKTHYPVEFMAALLTEDMDNTDKVVKNINEVRAMGIEVFPPDLNASERFFTVHGNAMRFGLGAVKGVGSAAIDAIIEARRERPFDSLHDFCERVDLRKVNKKVLEALIKCGALDSLPGHRAQQLAALEDALEVGQRVQRELAAGQDSLFGSTEIVSSGGGARRLPEIAPWEENVRLSFEKEALGFYITGHPLARHRDAIERFASCTAAGLAERRHEEEVTIAGVVAGKKELTTRKGERMAFVTLEDLTGLAELTVLPEPYRKALDLLAGEEPLLVSGTVEVGEESCKLKVQEVTLLSEAREKRTRTVHFRVPSRDLDPRRLRQLKDLMKRHRGSCAALLHLLNPPRCETVIELPQEIRVAASERIVLDVEKLFGYQVVTFE